MSALMSGHTPGPFVEPETGDITPGPWNVAQQNDDYYCVETKDCAICNDVAFQSDASLIAAAPDLLEALQRIASGKFDYNEAAEYRAIARAALAKASAL